MKATIDRDGCISCELCVEICPAVFRMDDENIAEVYCDPIPEEEEENAIEAQDSCPVSVITVE